MVDVVITVTLSGVAIYGIVACSMLALELIGRVTAFTVKRGAIGQRFDVTG